MRKAFIISVLAALVLTACHKETHWPPVKLEQNDVTAYLNITQTRVRVTGGSGGYAATVSDPSVADVSFERVPVAIFLVEDYLVVKPKTVGTVVVTVKDKRSGDVAMLSVTVEKRLPQYRVLDIVTSVEADSPEAVEAIEADLAATAHLAVGDGIEFDYGSLATSWVGGFVFSNAAGDVTFSGSMKTERCEYTDAPQSFAPFWPQEQILDDMLKLSFVVGDDEWVYYRMVVGAPYTRINMPSMQIRHGRYCEDLTKKYQAEFPDAGVRSVARMVVTPL
jgi:hypothetical protein